jgi:hypothetical protein
MFVCHTCDVPSCVRPDHLWLGSPADNSRDMVAKGRHRTSYGEEARKARLTEAQVREIRARYVPGSITFVQLAKEYGVNHGTIQHVIHRRTWKHIDPLLNVPATDFRKSENRAPGVVAVES